MVGIRAYSAYVPWYRLGKGTVGWASSGERPVAGHDEDSITMAVAAAVDCLAGLDRSSVDGLYFASTSSPYQEKLAAATVAAALDLREDVVLRDITGSLRAGTMALLTAADAVRSGGKQVLVVAADVRVAISGSDLERSVGDGAVAFLVADSDLVAALEDSYSVYDEIYDVWRANGDSTLRSWEDRFSFDEGYLRLLPRAVSQLLTRNGLSPEDLSRAVLYAPDVRRLREAATQLGFDSKAKVEDPLFSAVGNAGAAFTPMMLVSALEKVEPGERMVVGDYGGGADALLLTVQPAAAGVPRRLGAYLESKEVLPDYRSYAQWRGLIEVAQGRRRPPPPVPSASALFRERRKNISFIGVKCRNCGEPQYPPQRVCSFCHCKDDFDEYRFSDRRATLFTYTLDYVGSSLNPPLVVGMVDFEGGGRAMLELTDRRIDRLRVGMPLQMTFRRLYSTEGFHNYYWKCMPPRL